MTPAQKQVLRLAKRSHDAYTAWLAAMRGESDDVVGAAYEALKRADEALMAAIRSLDL